jgi:hypothetical protein
VSLEQLVPECIVSAQVRWLWLTAGFDFKRDILHMSHISEQVKALKLSGLWIYLLIFPHRSRKFASYVHDVLSSCPLSLFQFLSPISLGIPPGDSILLMTDFVF